MIEFHDLHTAGEPTRVIVSGFQDLGNGTISERCQRLASEHQELCAGIVREPRGHEAIVAALLLDSSDPQCDAGVIFFNNVGPLGMCGHGTIGVVRALSEMGRVQGKICSLETPAGIVRAKLHDDGDISVENVESFLYQEDVEITLDNGTVVCGDIAWGGNWFFITGAAGIPLQREGLPRLVEYSSAIRIALDLQGRTGMGGAPIDHVELHEDLPDEPLGVRCFVLCPGMEWDRSPCGTGTSATLALKAAKGKIQEGQTWIQESILGSRFSATYENGSQGILPTIRGRAYHSSRGQLIFEDDDPFRSGFPT